MKRATTSIHNMLTSQCVQIMGNERVFEVTAINDFHEIGIYFEDQLIGYIYARNRATFVIKTKSKGLDFNCVVKYNAVTGYGEKLPSSRDGHLRATKLVITENR